MMRGRVLAVLAAMALCLTPLGSAASPQADPGAVSNVLRSLQSADSSAGPLVHRNEAGFLRFVGAPAGGYFAVPGGAKSGGPDGAAQDFADYHGPAFGAVSPGVTLEVIRMLPLDERTVVRFEQHYDDLKVFGATMVVQVDAANRVLSAAGDLAYRLDVLDSGVVDVRPRLTAEEATAIAKARVASRHDGVTAATMTVARRAALEIFDPTVQGLSGPVRLVWSFILFSETRPDVSEAVLIDAHSGAEVFHYHFCAHIKNRIIVDVEDREFIPIRLDRTENQAPTGIEDLDLVYDVLGQTHDFFLFNHDWENWHGGQVPDRTDQFAFVRLPVINAFYRPWVDTNAEFDALGGLPTGATFYGTGLATDDVVAHEFTHGVTQFTSDLIYQGFSGAINESFSDIWGEFVDLTNDIGDDSPEVRWYLGEDISPEILMIMSGSATARGIRNMANPPEFGDPDRLNSPLLIDPTSGFDNGGVHINSGIGNKLCYLLTDGDDFNGQSVEGMGIFKTADLFWEAQNTIPSSGDYHDLYFALSQGAVNLGFSTRERVNLLSAMRAVEIVPAAIDRIRLRAVPTGTVSGRPAISVDWPEFDMAGRVPVSLIRAFDGFAMDETEGTVVFTGPETEFLDQNVFDGVTYYYTLLIDLGDSGIVQAFASATAGGEPAPILTEAFGEGNPLDLATTQLYFAPVGPPNTDVPGFVRQTGYENYELTVRHGVTALPIARSDASGQGIKLPFVDDQTLEFSAERRPVRFFGQDFANFYVTAQGYVSFQYIDPSSPEHIPTLNAHFAVPRISFLFNNLSPISGGEVWYRYLDDRFVLTFDRVPEWTPFTTVPVGTNTVQLEMFFSGHIRITYLQLSSSQAIVGLSDGRGFPVSPRDLFEEATSELRLTDLSQGGLVPSRLRFEPLAAINAVPGDLIEFDVVSVPPANAASTPQLSAIWSGEGPVPFADSGNGTGIFRWETGVLDMGLYHVRFEAFLGGQRAFIDQRIFLGDSQADPMAINLTLATADGLGDPTRDRTIAPGQALYAGYDYSHPGLSRPVPGNPLTAKQGDFSEGFSEIRWYRNNLAQAGYLGSFTIPAGTTRPNERWKFSVIPITRNGLVGPETFSPTVTVLDVPQISAVTPNFGAVSGGETVTIHGANLGGPLSVQFGGVAARSYTSRGDDRIEVVTPVRSAGTVEVTVTTAKGSGSLRRAFSYMADTRLMPNPDVNRDGVIDARDIQLVVNAVLQQQKTFLDADVNRDGYIDAADVQAVINAVLRR